MTCRIHRNLPPDVEPVGQDWPQPSTYQPRPRRSWLWLAWLLAIGWALTLALLVWLLTPARAHMKDRPDLDQWFGGLTSSNGSPCCSTVDGTEVRDIDWDTTVEDGQSRYRVRVEGQWITVRDHQVVTAPNKYGGPVVWVYHVDGKPQVRCFMPGAGG